MHINQIKQTFHLKRLLLILSLAGLVSSAYGWEQDWDLDAEMDVLDQPVRREIITPLGDGRQRGSPVWPLYKQQPAAAQGDFRSLPSSGEGIPADIPGLPGSDGGSGGGSVPGSGGGNDAPVVPEKPNDPGGGPDQPDGPQITPPDMGGPDIPLPPIIPF